MRAQRSRLLVSLLSATALFTLLFTTASASLRDSRQSSALLIARASHTATRLASGEILVVGGMHGPGALHESELIDPAGPRVRLGPESIYPRASHTATLLSDGRVLIAGGRDAAGDLGSTEIYDPASAAFSLGPPLQHARSGHTATTLANGDILFAGGDAAGTAELFDPAKETFTPVGLMAQARRDHAAVALADGRVLLAGGVDADGNALTRAEVFDPATGAFAKIGAMTTARVAPTLRVLPDGKVQVIGGGRDATMEIFNPDGHFTAKAYVLKTNAGAAAVSRSMGRSAVAGTEIVSGDAVLDELSSRRGFAGAIAGDKLVVAGGTNKSGQPSTKVTLLSTPAAWVTTDKTDYAPGQRVTVTGGGFAAGEMVTLLFERNPETTPSTTMTTTADANGGISNSDYVCLDTDAGVTFLLTATGATSGNVATSSFTDAAAANVTVTATAGAAGGTFRIARTLNGGGTSTTTGTTPTTYGVQANSSFTIDNIQTTVNGLSYTGPGTITGTAGAAASSITVTLQYCTPPSITTQPASQAVTYNNNATFSAAATGSPTPTIQWQQSTDSGATWSNVPGAISSTLTVSAPAVSQSGTQYHAVFTNSCGNATSNAATLTVNKAPSTTTVTCGAGPFTYDGTAQTPCSASVTGVGGLSASLTVSYSNNTNAGTATASATFAGDANHDGSTDSKNFTIGQASSTASVTCAAGPFTYNGSAQTPCSASVSGAGGLSGSLTVSYSNNTNAGTASASASYAGDTNHTASSDSKNFTIGQASSTTSVTCPAGPFTYTGAPQTPCSASLSGAGGLSGSPPVNYSNNVDAGTATASASYAGDSNHTASNDSKNFTIGQASSTITVTCSAGPFTYTGALQAPCSASLSGAGGLSGSPPVSYSNNVDAGTATASASYAGDSNHTGSNDSKHFTIGQASSTTSVTCPAGPFTYDGAAQTPCSASVSGAGGLSASLTVSYSDNTNAGTATASASYAGDSNHTGSGGSATFTIGQASSTTAVTCGAGPFTFDGAPQTPCTAALTGGGGLSASLTVNYSDNTNAGTATASASYGGDANHTSSSDSKTFTIFAAPSVTTVTCPSTPLSYTGSALQPCTAEVTGAGGLSASLTVSYNDNTNAGTASASASYDGDANHHASSGSGTFTIGKASSSTTVSCPASVTYNGSAQTPCTATVTGANGLSQPAIVIYSANTNAGTATASASFDGDANHDPSSGSASFTINQAPSTTTVTCTPGPFVYDGGAQTPCSAVAGGAGGLNIAVTPVSYSNNVDAGTATASATYAGDANHAGSSGSATFTIGQASSTTTVTCTAGPFPYSGSAQTPCSASVTGAGGLAASVTPVTYANNVDAGTATASASYAGDANHTGSSGSATFTIDKASSTTTVSCPAGPFTYSGSAQNPCTAAATGAGGLNQPLTVSYANNVNAGTASASASFAGDGNHTGSSGSANFTISRATPAIRWANPAAINCGTPLGATQLNATASVAGSFVYTPVAGTYLSVGTGQTLSVVFTPSDTANYTTASASVTIDVINFAPGSVSITAPAAPQPLGTTITATASFTDPGDLSDHTATWTWDDGTAPQTVPIAANLTSVSTTHKYAAAGVYSVSVVIADHCGLSSSAAVFQYVVIYDGNAGFVTGGGWINSPAGAYVANTVLTGKATFGFVSKYQKGATVPTGETQFQFQVANFVFQSTSYDWLVISGAKAQYKGSGTVTGAGSYGFLLTATDGDINGGGGVDKFRIKIWDKTTGNVVYDNVPSAFDDIDTANPQAIGGGSIVIHK
jgi:hypothetical protein